VRLKETNELAGEIVKGHFVGTRVTATSNGCAAEMASIFDNM